jgi:hypothetical protein
MDNIVEPGDHARHSEPTFRTGGDAAKRAEGGMPITDERAAGNAPPQVKSTK